MPRTMCVKSCTFWAAEPEGGTAGAKEAWALDLDFAVRGTVGLGVHLPNAMPSWAAGAQITADARLTLT